MDLIGKFVDKDVVIALNASGPERETEIAGKITEYDDQGIMVQRAHAPFHVDVPAPDKTYVPRAAVVSIDMRETWYPKREKET